MRPVPSDFFFRVSVPTQPSLLASFLEVSRLSDPVGELGDAGFVAIPNEECTSSLFLALATETVFLPS